MPWMDGRAQRWKPWSSVPMLALASCLTLIVLRESFQSAIRPLLGKGSVQRLIDDSPLEYDYDGLHYDVTRCKGYNLAHIQDTLRGFTGKLELLQECNAFGADVKDLTLEVDYDTASRLHVHIYDTDQKHFQLDPEFWPRAKTSGNGGWQNDGDFVFNYTRNPFEFWITRRSSDDIVFDTRAASIPKHSTVISGAKDSLRYRNNTALPAYPLIFEDRYLQIASALPSGANIYGLGEVSSSSGFRRDQKGSVSTMWAADRGTPIDSNIYGAFPFYLEHRIENGPGRSHGVFLLSSQGMDVILRDGVVEYRSLGGTLDFTFYSGPTPKDVIQQHGQNVGFPLFPPMYALGFNLCRWGWNNIQAVEQVVAEMRKADIPLETIWSDIDHMDHYKDFTNDEDKYPLRRFQAFIERLHDNHQSFIPIVDAGIKTATDYDVFARGLHQEVFVKTSDGHTNYYGEVWPGSAAYPDFLAPNTQAWWTENLRQFAEHIDFDGIWLDMNEPASFCVGPCYSKESPNGKQLPPSHTKQQLADPKPLPYGIHNAQHPVHLGRKTMSPAARHFGNVSHVDVHNVYGYSIGKATYNALQELRPEERPYIISRSTFSKSGSFTGHWSGDNEATWFDLRQSIQAILQFQLFQIPFVGFDACGFGGDTTEELCNRWMQLAAFTPWFRNHNTKGTISQEPYRWSSVAEASRQAIKIRYTLLPYWYTLYAAAHQQGLPVVEALFFSFPNEPSLLDVSTQFMIGSHILVTPVLERGATKVKGSFPDHKHTIWRDWYTHRPVTLLASEMELEAPLGHIPLHIRGGFATLLFAKPAYTVHETRQGGYSLLISLDRDGFASGGAYLDDGESQSPDDYRWLSIAATTNRLQIATTTGLYFCPEDLISATLLGVPNKPSKVIQGGRSFDFSYESELERLNITIPGISLDNMILIEW